MSLPRSLLVVGMRGVQLPSGVVRARGLHTSLVVTAGEKMGKPDPKWALHYCHCENIAWVIIVSGWFWRAPRTMWRLWPWTIPRSWMDGQDPWCSPSRTGQCLLMVKLKLRSWWVPLSLSWQYWFDFQVTIQEGCVYSRFSECAQDPETKVLILTGADPYYCAGVDLSATIKPMHPKYVKSFSDDLYQFSVLSTSF